MAAYYNEIDSYCVAWLQNLIKAKLIAEGDVDSRSITEVSADDIKGYTQCHFFAGIAGWSYALRLAGISDDQQVWTGSCPCQPFSNAGKRKGFDDERHLWPEFARLIGDCQPPIVFGEQVEAAIREGWFDVICDDLEAKGYACGASVLPACSVGAPHIRQRLWWVAYTDSQRPQRGLQRCNTTNKAAEFVARCSSSLADTESARLDGRNAEKRPCSDGCATECGSGRRGREDNGGDTHHWNVEPNVGRLAYGVSNKVGRLRAFGNTIVPQVAAEFIKAAMSVAP